MTNRFVDHLPFHRQERPTSAGTAFPSRGRRPMAWALDVAERWFAPLVEVMLEEVLASGSLNTDDTPVKVRDAHGKRRYQGRFWTYVGDDLHPHTVLRYTPNHSRDGPGGPAEVLKNYSGFVQADAFSGYDAIYLGSQGRIVEVACWAHARRKFFEAQNADRARAEIAIAHIAQLYAVEKELREHRNGDWRELDRAGTLRADSRRAAGAVAARAEAVRRLAGSGIAAGVAEESVSRGDGIHPQQLDGVEPVRAPRSFGDRQQRRRASIAGHRHRPPLCRVPHYAELRTDRLLIKRR